MLRAEAAYYDAKIAYLEEQKKEMIDRCDESPKNIGKDVNEFINKFFGHIAGLEYIALIVQTIRLRMSNLWFAYSAMRTLPDRIDALKKAKKEAEKELREATPLVVEPN